MRADKTVDGPRERYLFSQNLRRVQELLISVPSVTWLGLVVDEFSITPTSLWKSIVNIDSEPTTKIPGNLPKHEIDEWLKNCLHQVGSVTEYYLSIGGMGMLPWIKIGVSTGEQWILDIWDLANVHDMLIVPVSQFQMLAITSEEWYYYAFIQKIFP